MNRINFEFDEPSEDIKKIEHLFKNLPPMADLK